MRKNRFNNDARVRRTSTSTFSNYRDYDNDLRNDFNNRCGYCGSSHTVIQSFEIDHFIPERQFKGRDDSLKTKYSNLVYSCKKCNRMKAGKFEEGTDGSKIENVRFYDPGTIDFNEIFFRDKYGFIKSEDIKGKKMIMDLKLYNPIYGIAWMIEETEKTLEFLSKISESIKFDVVKKCHILELYASLNEKLLKMKKFLNNNIDCKLLNE